MMLSPNFSLEELCKSHIAIRAGIDNTATDPKVINNLKLLSVNIFQPIRDHFKIPYSPSSGYRSPALNSIIPNSNSNSQHCKGQAGDIELPGVSNIDLARWIYNNLQFDQLILEFHNPTISNSGWVHVSFNKDNLRKQCLQTPDGRKFNHLIC
jgi:zinc D-Ala-D-Ala carboxypeptidase